MSSAKIPHERLILFLLGLCQFVNVLEFMMVMPLGPDLAKEIGLPEAKLGLMGSAYTFSAALAGIAGMFLLGRFPRKGALVFCLLGMSLGTILGGFAQSAEILLCSRLLAGLFGGPATSLTLALVADIFPLERRGRAMGAVMSAFSVAAVAGVPLTLELASVSSWRSAFISVGLLVALTALCLLLTLPTTHASLIESPGLKRVKEFLSQKRVWLAYSVTSCGMISGFAIIPNIAAYIQNNLGFPRDGMGGLYLAGGLLSFIAMRIGGWCVDRFGAARVVSVATFFLVPLITIGFVAAMEFLTPIILFMTFMPIMSIRNVSFQAMHTKVPRAEDRAIYMPGLSTINHLGSALGAFLSSCLLSQDASGVLIGMPQVGILSIVFALLLLPLIWRVERG